MAIASDNLLPHRPDSRKNHLKKTHHHLRLVAKEGVDAGAYKSKDDIIAAVAKFGATPEKPIIIEKLGIE